MHTVPKVSVLIPTYNYAHFLDETIQSVLDQTYTDFELIIVDNHSTDNTDEVVKKYLADDRVRFYVNETNVGLGGNWNKCLDYARGKYIKFLCADDKFHPQLLEKFVPVMDQYPNVSIATCYNEMFGLKSGIRTTPLTGLLSGRATRESLLKVGAKNWLSNPSVVLFRTSAVLKVGKFNTELYYVTDLEYYMRLLTVGDCYVISERLSYVRAHPDTQTATEAKKKFERIFESYKYMSILRAKKIPSDTAASRSLIQQKLRQRAIRSTAVMFRVLPKLYVRNNRDLFKTAFQIATKEGVMLATLFYYINWRTLFKFVGIGSQLVEN